MLEDPSYAQIVRWGDDNDSFVVLEVNAQPPHPRGAEMPLSRERQRLTYMSLSSNPVRKIYQVDPPKTLQAQQFRQFCTAAQQI